MEKHRLKKSCGFFFSKLKYLHFLNNPNLFLSQISSAFSQISLGQPGKLSSGSPVPCVSHMARLWPDELSQSKDGLPLSASFAL